MSTIELPELIGQGSYELYDLDILAPNSHGNMDQNYRKLRDPGKYKHKDSDVIGVHFSMFSHTSVDDFIKDMETLTGVDFPLYLNLMGCPKIQKEAWQAISRLPTLCGLKMDEADIRAVDFGLLHGHEALRAITVTDCEYKPDSLKQLAQVESLQFIDLTNTKLNGHFLKALAAMPRLQHLNLNCTGLSSFKGLLKTRSLKGLKIGCERVKDLSYLAELKTLESLAIYFNATDKLVTTLGDCKQLKQLTLYNSSGISDAAIKTIVKLKNLENLCLDHTNVTDAGVKGLLKLKKLQSLSLNRTEITHEVFSLLAETALIELDVRSNDFPKKQCKKFEALMKDKGRTIKLSC